MRLEEDQIGALRRWGQALREAGGAELAPAGRAILMLLEEVERLRLELVRTRDLLSREDPANDEAVADAGEALGPTLRGRLQRAARRDSGSSVHGRQESAEEMGAGAVGERETISPEAWIESLRRQE